ncbi:tannase and feruloyl esterase-domain-containing protein [Hypoxylon crocopeplum]|nr:tannase and feruloyl esterase-domain-containing protein [Hypoxylon crocopeplum]
MIPSLCNGTIPASACSASAIPFPSLFGAEFLSLEANFVSNYSQSVHSGFYVNHGAISVENLNYCNVTVTYTHPGQNDAVHVQVWMPSDTWNGRLQAIGGAGWQAGLHYAGLQGMMAAMGEGYATVGTDAGLGSDVYPTNWGLVSEGNVNLYLFQNMASVSLNDAAVISKSIVNSFYGQPPKYSYFTGCSQGGRQGMMLAQRYPDAYDGIAASAPAINWDKFFVSYLWPTYLMDSLGEYPPSCEIDALTEAAIDACDGLDGVSDGIIADPSTCTFDPTSLVGKVINCTNFGTERPISAAAATIVKGAWEGPKRVDNSSIWFGVGQDSVLSDTTQQTGVISTTCSTNGTCTINNVDLAAVWVKFFINRNSSSTIRYLSHEEYDHIAHASTQIYESVIAYYNRPDVYRIDKPLSLTSWGLMYKLLRANFDGLASAACPNPPAALPGDGSATFLSGKKVVGLETSPTKVVVRFVDVATNQEEPMSADMLIGADGIRSPIRKLVRAPTVERYAGYVAWRGTVSESLVSKETFEYFSDWFCMNITKKSYLIGYNVPTDDGNFTLGERLINFIWYTNLADSSAEMNDVLTDVKGAYHRNTVPRGLLRPEVWERVRATAQVTAPFAEVLAKVKSTFMTKINDAFSAASSFYDGRVVVVCDAFASFRPHAAAAEQAAFHSHSLELVYRGEKA